jgi:predicted aspartyl protease
MVCLFKFVLNQSIKAMKKILSLISFLIISNSIYSQKIIDQINFKLINNNLFVNVMINGKGPYNFIYDTGASGLGRIDERVAKELNLSVVDSLENTDGAGNSKMEPMVGIKNMALGKIKLKNIKLMRRNYNAKRSKNDTLIDGIIGEEFLSQYLLSFDFPNNKLSIIKGSLNTTNQGVLNYGNDGFIIRGKMGKIDTVFHIDSGSSLAMHVPKSIIEKCNYELTGKTRKARKAYTEFTLYEVLLKDEISLSNVKAKDLKIEYSDKATYVNVGMGFLKNYKMTLDQKNKLILIE